MKYKVEITAQAESDLRSIYEYIALELLAPGNAAGLLERLEKGIMGLDSMPFRYREYEFEPWKSRGLHIMPIGKYVVLYIPDENKATVSIIRIMYSGRDVENQLNEHTDY